jgi:beta-phosphoglucomutase-like phosphatase (HAD superfamily)
MQFQGIIFDFNGVLLWDADWQARSWQEIARTLRGREMTTDELAEHVYGRPSADVLSYIAGRQVDGIELKSLIEAKESFYRELCLMNPRRFALSPGAQDLLDLLAERDLPRTIATSSGSVNMKFFIQHLRLDRWFQVGNIVHDDGERPGKPAPDIYAEASRRIGVAPHWCVVVEDAISGLTSAQAAGIGYLVGLGPTATHQEILNLPGVSLAIKSLRDFPLSLLGMTNRAVAKKKSD